MSRPSVLCAACLVLAACAPRVLVPLPGPESLARERASAPSGIRGAAAGSKDDPRLQPFSEDQPAQVASDRLMYSEKGRVTVFQGRVRVHQGTTRVEAPFLEVRSDDGRACARQGVRLIDHARGITVTAQELEYRQTLANARARGNVRLYSHDNQGQPLQMRSDRLDWDNQRKEALAQGAVQVTYRSSTATAGTMHYRQADQILELTADGNTRTARPVIAQEGNTITGDVITLRLNERVYEVTGSARADLIPRAPDKK